VEGSQNTHDCKPQFRHLRPTLLCPLRAFVAIPSIPHPNHHLKARRSLGEGGSTINSQLSTVQEAGNQPLASDIYLRVAPASRGSGSASRRTDNFRTSRLSSPKSPQPCQSGRTEFPTQMLEINHLRLAVAANPNGIESFSPTVGPIWWRSARTEGLPWVTCPNRHNPERG
jgi:hypothetical protein